MFFSQLEMKTAISDMLKQVKTAALNNSNKTKSAHPRLERKTSNPRDFNCFLVTTPQQLSSDDKLVQQFCEEHAPNMDIVVEIPG